MPWRHLGTAEQGGKKSMWNTSSNPYLHTEALFALTTPEWAGTVTVNKENNLLSIYSLLSKLNSQCTPTNQFRFNHHASSIYDFTTQTRTADPPSCFDLLFSLQWRATTEQTFRGSAEHEVSVDAYGQQQEGLLCIVISCSHWKCARVPISTNSGMHSVALATDTSKPTSHSQADAWKYIFL